jgi:phosphoribosylamine--glycine ligase
LKVLIIGGGGREHCLAWKISQCDSVSKVFAVPGNAGMVDVAACINMGISEKDFKAIAHLAEAEGIEMVVVGPEAPLVDGIADYMGSRGLVTFGPVREAAIIEGSKVFTKKLCNKYGIPTAKAEIFGLTRYEEARTYIQGQSQFPIVIKADGLAAGKGVIIAADMDEALNALDECMVDKVFGDAGNTVMIEEFLSGYEMSILCLSDGNKIIPMELAQDYKRIFDNDMGKNTGGMGSYSPVPMVEDKVYQKSLDKIIYPTGEALKRENMDYRGVLYAGILVSDGEPYLLEYNCRFGDPETQAVLPRLKDDLSPILYECARGSLSTDKLSWTEDSCICVIAASRGYPESSSNDDIISGLDELKDMEDIVVFHAGTKIEDGNIVTNGGRVLGVTATGEGFRQTRKKAYDAMGKISFEGMQYRKDIAKKAEEEPSEERKK